MRAVMHRVGANLIPVLAVAMDDGSQFIVTGTVVGASQFERDYQEVEEAEGSLSVAQNQSAPESDAAPKKRARKRA